MRNIIASVLISFDGYMTGPTDEMDWVIADEPMGTHQNQKIATADTLLLGRLTYDHLHKLWAHAADHPKASTTEKEFGRQITSIKEIVFSHTLQQPEWHNTEVIKELNPEFITQLKQQPGKDILIIGSVSIIDVLLEHQLIDELHLYVHPILLSAGKPLFKDLENKVPCEVIDTHEFASGVTLMKYRPRYQSASKK